MLFWGFGRIVMNIFVSDTGIIENAVKGICITSTFFIALGMGQILRYLLNGAGDSAYAMINGIVEIICRLVRFLELHYRYCSCYGNENRNRDLLSW